jgi:hypothetical protein
MLFGWKSPRHMKYGVGRSTLTEARKFYVDYINKLYPSDDEEEEADSDPPWEAESIAGEMT